MPIPYSSPLDRLLPLGGDLSRRPFGDYRTLGLGPEHVSDLLRMAVDPALNRAPTESKEVWAPMHAWRAAAQLGGGAVAQPLVDLLAELYEDDVAFEDIPEVLGRLGQPALAPAAALLADAGRDTYLRISAAHALRDAGRAYPDCRDEAAGLLRRQLEGWEEQDGDLNGFLVSYLADLRDERSADLVRAAFDGGGISTAVCGDWDDLRWEFGAVEPGEDEAGLAGRTPGFDAQRLQRLMDGWPGGRERFAESLKAAGALRPGRTPGSAAAKAAGKRKAQKAARKKNRKR